MASLRPTLSTTQKIVAVYSDPAQYERADVFARRVPAKHYRRELTYFLIDAEALIHGSQVATERSLRDKELWQLRRDLCLQTTGKDLLLATRPSREAWSKWRDSRLPNPVSRHDPATGEPRDILEWLTASTESYKAGLPEVLSELRDTHERTALRLADSLRVQEPSPWENAARFSSDELLLADGTVIEPPSHVEVYATADAESGEVSTVVVGSRASDKNAHARISVRQSSEKPYGPASGINHVALMLRTEFGRVLLTIDRAMGGEVHAALDGLERIHALAPQRMRAICYDAALDGWQADYVLAKFGLLPISPLKAEEGDDQAQQAATKRAKKTYVKAHGNPRTPSASMHAELLRTWMAGPDSPTATFNAVKEYEQAREEGRAAGSGLPLGQSVTIDRTHRIPTPKKSLHGWINAESHTVDGRDCIHEIYLDNGGIWTVRLHRGEYVKDQRLFGRAERRFDKHAGSYYLKHHFTLTCPEDGTNITFEVTPTARAVRHDRVGSKPKGRHLSQDIRLVAESDPLWRSIYGRRNDTESWFSWLKGCFIADEQSRFSINLNHQFLEILHAAALTNSITRYHAHEEGVLT